MTQLAIIAATCRFPGAPDAAALWRLIRRGKEGIRRLSAAELQTLPARVRHRPGFVPVAGALHEPTHFDAAAFGMSDHQAVRTDPQHRLALELVADALDAAGWSGEDATGPVGVFAGAALSGHLMDALRNEFHPRSGSDPVTSFDLHTRNVADYLPQRLAHHFDFTGPTMAVGATCATGLVAVHQAAASLLAGECDAAIAAAVSLRLPQDQGYIAVPDGPFSTDGHTRAFGAGASGTVFTQGAGAVVLRRLEDAQADGSPILGVLTGSAVGNDGAARAGFTAPTVAGQARVIAEAQALAGIEPREVELLEAHGTGTALGDPIELRALNEVFGESSTPWCALGSVKSNIGHADSAAGMAGLIKALWAVREGIRPRTLHAEEANPALELEGSAFRLATSEQPWRSERRIAGVSSFGVGGTNAHVILEQAPRPIPRAAGTSFPVALVQGADASATTELADAVKGRLAADPKGRDAVASTLAHRRRPLPWRSTVSFDGEVRTPVRVAQDPRLVWVFGGGGSQFIGMARGLHGRESAYTESIDRIADLLQRAGGADPREVLLGRDADARVPRLGLPALFSAQVAMADLLRAHGLRPDAVLGHSVGEYAAAVVAGILSEADACTLVAERSRLLSEVPAGRMLSLAWPESRVQEFLAAHPALDLAAVNGPTACVVAGPDDAIDRAERAAQAAGAQAEVVQVDVAAHSRLVDAALPVLRRATAGMHPEAPKVALFTTVTGRAITTGEARDPEHWVRHLRAPVRFADALASAIRGPSIVQQIGPGASLVRLARAVDDVVATLTTQATADDLAEDPELNTRAWRASVAAMWAHGGPIDLDRLYDRSHPVAALPSYPWQRRDHSLPSLLGPDFPDTPASGPTDTGVSDSAPFQVPTWFTVETVPGAGAARWCVVTGDDDAGSPARPLAHALVDALRARGDEVVEWADAKEVTALVWIPSGDVSQTLLDARHVRERLGEDSHLVCVTFRAEDVLGVETVDPHATAATGLPRVIAQETPGVRWRTVDLDGDPEVATVELVAELDDLIAGGPANRQRAIRGRRHFERRWTHRPRPVLEPDLQRMDPQRTGPERGRVVLVTGGTGQVGMRLTERLVDLGDDVVLTSRTEPTGEVAERLAAWPGVRWERCDVSESGVLTALVQRVIDEHGRLDIVVHAPVVVDVTAFEEMDADTIATSIAPKVDGVDELAAALDAAGISPRVVLMSSAAGTIGGFGLSAYVAASRYLDGIAHTRRDWVALDWDRWRFGTDAERLSAAEVTMRHALDADDGITALLAILAADHLPHQLAVSPSELDSRAQYLDVRRRVADGQHLVGADLGPRERLVAEIWAEVLGCAVTSAEDDFFALGGHSLVATRVLARLRDTCGVDLRLRDLLTASTVARLAELLPEDAGRRSGPGRSDSGVAPGESTDRSQNSGMQERSGQVITGADPCQPFDLTRVQHAYWVGRDTGYGLGGVGCHFFLEYAAESLDHGRYEQAWRRVLERHPMLRTHIDETGRQRATPEVDFSLAVHDLREAPDAATRLAEHRQRLSTRVADPATGPMILPEIVRMPDADHVLISVDVLMCDSASWMIVDRDLQRWYTDPEWRPEPLEVTFADCVPMLTGADPVAAARREADRAHWMERLDDLPLAPSLPVTGTSEVPAFTRLGHRIDADMWNGLVGRARAEGITPTALVLDVYSEVLHRWSRDDRFSITVTVFDRPRIHPQVGDIVGEFTSMLLLGCEGFDQPRRGRAQRLQERLFDALDHRAFSGLDVLTEKSRRLDRQVNVPVVFTGMLGLEPEHDHAWLGEHVGGLSQTPQVWLDHQVFEHRGELVLQWDVSDVLGIEAARGWFKEYIRALEGRVDATSWNATPAVTDAAVTTAPDADDPLALRVMGPAGTGPGESRDQGIAGRETSAPDEVMPTITEVWAMLLHLDTDDVTPDASFLSLGGDSLLAVRMANALRGRLGVQLPLQQVRADVTCRSLAERVVELRDVDDAESAADRSEGVETAAGGVLRRPDPSASFPLLPLQQAYFVGQQNAFDISYETAHVYTDVALDEIPCDDPQEIARRLRAACDHLVWKQPALRIAVTADGRQFIRDVNDPGVRIGVDVFDLRVSSDSEADLAAIRDDRTRNGPNPVVGGSGSAGSGGDGAGPTAWVGVTLLPQEAGESLCGRLHVSTSLLVVDGWSASLFDRELLAHLVGEPESEPLEIDFGDYVETLTELTDDAEHRADRAWWFDRIDALPEPPRLPLEQDPAELDTDHMTMLEKRIDPDTWTRIRESCGRHDVTAASAVLTAYAVELAGITGQDALLLTTLQHNREPLHPDVNRMIGAFSRTALVGLDLSGGLAFDALTRRVQRDQAMFAEHRFTSAVEVTREIMRRTGRHESAAPVVFQSTLGMDAALGGDLPSDGGPIGTLDICDYHQQVRTPQVRLELRCFELMGELIFSVAVVPGLYGDLPQRILDGVHERVLGLLDAGWDAPVVLEHAESNTRVEKERPVATVDDLTPRMRAVADTAATVWRDILQLDHTPRHEDDFFDLGGDSLLAMRMLRNLRAQGIDAMLRSFLADSTPAGLARAVVGDGSATVSDARVTPGAVAEEYPELAQIPTGDVALPLSSGRGRPIFWLHPSGGDVLCYLELARRLESDRPMIGLADPGLSGHAVPQTIRALVALYVRAIVEEQPEGPYTLGGWSMGGTVAHEVARELRRTGREVDLVIMLDANSPERIIRLTGAGAELVRLRHFRSIEAYLGLDLGDRDDADELKAALADAGVLGSDDALAERIGVFERHLVALGEHHAGVLDGTPVLLLRAAERSPRNGGEGMGVDDIDDADLGWGQWITGAFAVHDVPAHHYSILREPALDHVVPMIDEALRVHGGESRAQY